MIYLVLWRWLIKDRGSFARIELILKNSYIIYKRIDKDTRLLGDWLIWMYEVLFMEDFHV
jgi:hypothetical protein